MNRPSDELVSAAEVWAAAVLRLHAELDLVLADAPESWGGDDLVGVYHKRNRVEARLVADGLLQPPGIVRATDELLRAFSVNVSSAWTDVLGHEAGAGWWWSLVPLRGPVREDLARYGFRA